MSIFKNFAEQIPEEKKEVYSGSESWGAGKSIDLVREVVSAGGINVMRESDKGGDHYFHLKACVFDSTHTKNDAAIIVRANGIICYHCFHNSCESRAWTDVRAMFLPKKQPAPTNYQPPKKNTNQKNKKTPLVDKIVKFYKTGLTRGHLTGWASLDNYYTVLPGQWTLVTGIPSHGKSAFLDALMVNLNKLHGWKFVVFSPENYPLEIHASKLIEIITGESFMGTYKRQRISEQNMISGAKLVDDVFSFIHHDEKILPLDGILEKARSIMAKKKIHGMVIDPWNEIDHVIGTDTETLYISKALTKIRLFARNNNIHIWVVAHPTKMQKNTSGSYEPPTPYDVAGGAHWRNKADCSITVHRPTFSPGDFRVDIHVQKIRFKHVGRAGTIPMEYDLDCGQYHELY